VVSFPIPCDNPVAFQPNQDKGTNDGVADETGDVNELGKGPFFCGCTGSFDIGSHNCPHKTINAGNGLETGSKNMAAMIASRKWE
jgi:hypothetical protein